MSQKCETDLHFFFVVSARALLDYALESPGVYEFYHTETPVQMRGKGYAAIVSTVRKRAYKVHFQSPN
jgi:predicted GNAT family acetyltransferase